MNTIQYSAWRLSVHKLFTSCIRWCLVLVTEWCYRYIPCYLFSVSNSVYFFSISVSQAAQLHAGLPNIRHWTLPKIWVSFSDGLHSKGNDFELILMVKMETRNFAEGSFGSEFSAICNHCVVMVAWSRKTLKFCEKFLHFFQRNDPLR